MESLPIESSIGRSFAAAALNDSSLQGYQSTGLWACWRRYGDFPYKSLLLYLCSAIFSTPPKIVFNL